MQIPPFHIDSSLPRYPHRNHNKKLSSISRNGNHSYYYSLFKQQLQPSPPLHLTSIVIRRLSNPLTASPQWRGSSESVTVHETNHNYKSIHPQQSQCCLPNANSSNSGHHSTSTTQPFTSIQTTILITLQSSYLVCALLVVMTRTSLAFNSSPIALSALHYLHSMPPNAWLIVNAPLQPK